MLEQLNNLPKLKKIIKIMQGLIFKTLLNRFYFFIKLAVVFVFMLFASELNAQNKLKTVVIDAGHGGRDPGAVGAKSLEKDIALAIALKLGHYIETLIPDVEIIYTRKTDEFVQLKERAEIANRNKADLMISIHANSVKTSTVYGTSTYVMGLGKSDDNLFVALQENSALRFEENVKERYNEFKGDTMPSHIINSLIQTKNLEYSLVFAKLIQDQFRTRVGRKDLGIRQDNLVVLWYTTMPSVLVETGFISNSKEERYLMSAQGQDFLASAIFRAFRDYKNKYDTGNLAFKTGKVVKYNPVDIVFHVQIRSSVKPINLKSKEFKGLLGVKELRYGGRYNYIVGHEYEMSKVLIKQKQVRAKIPDAYIVATKNGKIISVSEAKKIILEN